MQQHLIVFAKTQKINEVLAVSTSFAQEYSDTTFDRFFYQNM